MQLITVSPKVLKLIDAVKLEGFIVQIYDKRVSFMFSNEGKAGFYKPSNDQVCALSYVTQGSIEDLVRRIMKDGPDKELTYYHFDSLAEFCSAALAHKWTF